MYKIKRYKIVLFFKNSKLRLKKSKKINDISINIILIKETDDPINIVSGIKQNKNKK